MASMPDMKSVHWPTAAVLIVAFLAILGIYHLVHKH